MYGLSGRLTRERPLQASWYQGLTDAKKLVFFFSTRTIVLLNSYDFRTIVLVVRGDGRGPMWAGSRVCRISRPAPASAADRASRLERCRASMGGPSSLRLLTEAPGPSPRKCRSWRSAEPGRVDSLGTVTRPAHRSGGEVAVYRAISGPGKGTCRGGPAWSTHAEQNGKFLAESPPERR